MKPKALLFDLDGTLVNTLRVFPQLIAQEFMSNPTPISIRKYLHRLGVIYNSGDKHGWFKPELFLTIKADFNLSWLKLARGLARVYWLFLKWDSSPHIFPQVVETLTELKSQGYLLGIVSNGSPRLLKKRFGPHLDIFNVLIESKTLGVSKPSPIPLYYACFKLNINKKDAVFIGDTLVDLLAAKNAKMRVILVRTGVFGDNFPIDDVGYEPISLIPAVGKDLMKVLSKI
ncbi:MAG: HAD family hydrolase [Candidatus Hodarchaeales archaeon]|jgi:HAD superfamily hydrolase (TIGR01662 family)